MKTYYNQIVINGITYAHRVDAFSYSEALEINNKLKEIAKRNGRKVIGRLTIEP